MWRAASKRASLKDPIEASRRQSFCVKKISHTFNRRRNVQIFLFLVWNRSLQAAERTDCYSNFNLNMGWQWTKLSGSLYYLPTYCVVHSLILLVTTTCSVGQEVVAASLYSTFLRWSFNFTLISSTLDKLRSIVSHSFPFMKTVSNYSNSKHC